MRKRLTMASVERGEDSWSGRRGTARGRARTLIVHGRRLGETSDDPAQVLTPFVQSPGLPVNRRSHGPSRAGRRSSTGTRNARPPVKGQIREGFAAEERGPHTDMGGRGQDPPDFVESAEPLEIRELAQIIRRKGGITGSALQFLEQQGDAVGAKDDIVIEEHQPG